MTKKLATKWIAALRSGKYKQGKGFLRDENDNYCCLGVLLSNIQYPRNVYEYDGHYKQNIPENFKGFKHGHGFIPSLKISLAELNDVKEYTFADIANIIEKHYKEL